MWEISLVVVAVSAALAFVARSSYRKLAGGSTDQCQCAGACSSHEGSCCRGSDPMTFSDILDSTRSASPRDVSSSSLEPTDSPGTDSRPEACSLFSMQPGRKATVLALTGGREFQAKLVSMGFNVGSEVTVLGGGGGGSGLLVATGDTRLAIGNEIAERIVVAADPTDGFLC